MAGPGFQNGIRRLISYAFLGNLSRDLQERLEQGVSLYHAGHATVTSSVVNVFGYSLLAAYVGPEDEKLGAAVFGAMYGFVEMAVCILKIRPMRCIEPATMKEGAMPYDPIYEDDAKWGRVYEGGVASLPGKVVSIPLELMLR